jgi:hypothetical protein
MVVPYLFSNLGGIDLQIASHFAKLGTAFSGALHRGAPNSQ